MADNGKKLVTQITPMDEDFGKWYTDIVKKADLIDYSSVKGCVILRPYGYAIWENIQRLLDARFKETGVENVYMPLFIPESLLTKEKEHVEGFAPEVAWVTMGGSERLPERLCVRPTSETLFCEHYANVIKSYRDLPKVYNQWCSVVRWEKTTRPFLRTREFLWQEGHTMHRTAEEAEARTVQMLNVYADFYENDLAIPVIKGQKTDKEKFAGAVATYTVEALMHDGKALQGGTSHNFGDGFAKAFGVQFLDSDNTLKTPFQTSWGVSTRMIGGIIMTHGDDEGLVLPPAVAPIQVVIIPIQQHKDGVLDAARALADTLRTAGIRVKVDDFEQSPGWKFSEYEMKGVPLRVEIGPRDIAEGKCVIVRRDNREKSFVQSANIVEEVNAGLEALRKALFEKARENRERRTFEAHNLDELKEIAATKSGYIKAMWCGDTECELKLKEVADVSSRCMPFDGEAIAAECVCCGRAAKKLVYWGKAY